MKAFRFTKAQRAFILKQRKEGTPVAEVCRKAGISQAIYFNLKKRYGGLLPARTLTLGWARELVDGILSGCGVSIRRACEALRFDPSNYHHKSRQAEQAAVELRIRDICEKRVRYGYRRVHVSVRREGWQVNIKRTRKICNVPSLQLRNKNPKRRVKAKLRDDREEAVGPEQCLCHRFCS